MLVIKKVLGNIGLNKCAEELMLHFKEINENYFLHHFYKIIGGTSMEDRKFRNAMGKFATGVTVITTEVDGITHGMTANAFMSVSLNPKLIVVSIGEKASMLEKIKSSGKYAVNVLSAQQQELSMNFAGQMKESLDVQFDSLNGFPVLPGAIVQVVCDVVSEYTEGDHTLFIGKVLDLHVEDHEPLLYYNGGYRSLPNEEKND